MASRPPPRNPNDDLLGLDDGDDGPYYNSGQRPPVNDERMLSLMEGLREHLRSAGVRRAVYKTIPHIYHRMPAEEDLYALFRLEARLIRRGFVTNAAVEVLNGFLQRQAASTTMSHVRNFCRKANETHCGSKQLAADQQ